MIPSDIQDAARECLSAILAAGVDIHPTDQPKAQEAIAASLLREREQLQVDVIAAVADESPECRRRVFIAVKRGLMQ